MEEHTMNRDIIQATKEGRLFMDNADFFGHEKVRELVKRLRNSTIYEDIERFKQKRQS